jgi:hypothetical protein
MTERAAVVVARGVAIAEGQIGWASEMPQAMVMPSDLADSLDFAAQTHAASFSPGT